MKISQLSAQSGIPLPTIKMYLREGLLPPGERTDVNQANYSDDHLRRLRVITGLVKVGGLSIAAARSVLAAADSEIPLAYTLGVAQHAASAPIDQADVRADDLAHADEIMAAWDYSPDGPGRLGVAQVVGAFAASGQPADTRWLARYAEAALLVAEADLDLIDTRETREEKSETVVIGTVLGDALFAALRRTAQEHVSNQRYNPPTG
ncbi:MerR family transcriptional regulator [Glaciibacter sp. 2TAF33]|uniref:MerR family transcriptional regulator n=1 Tax=Glaciibacter sp. 2TAF33 TaxID=3233015 RepID=UPI003F8F1182